MEQDIQEKIEKLCSFVCNGKTYQYEQKLQKSAEHELYDAAIIYAWNIFMLFVYEKVWQIRELEKLNEDTKFQTDKKAFLVKINPNNPDKFPDDFFDGHLCNLNKLHTENKGEDFIIARLVDVYPNIDQQYFKKAQKILKSRHDGAHINEIQQDENDLSNVLRELTQVIEKIQEAHNQHLRSIFDNLEKNKQWYLSNEDMRYIDTIFSSGDIDKSQYVHIAELVSRQEFTQDTISNIKQNAIDYFLQSNNWNTAHENALLLIKPLINYLDEEDVKRILKGVFDKREHVYNQILQAGNIEDIFWELYQLSSNNFPDLENDWKNFAQKLKDENYGAAFDKLIPEIENEKMDKNI